jgi:hypothetical protein
MIVLLALLLAVPVPIGTGPRYHPARAARSVPGLACSARETPRFGVHVELFANRRVVIVPAGIGVVPPLRRDGAYVLGGRCSYPLRTREPTGVVEVSTSARLSLGDLFGVWGQPLSAVRLSGFTGQVRAYVDGKPWTGDVRAIPLVRHAEIVLEVGGYVRPHRFFVFRKGL